VKRGDVVTVAVQGDYGKPRPAVVVQSDLFNETHPSITVLPLTSTIVDASLIRLTVDPGRENGLTRVSQVMVDKFLTLPREKIGESVGRLDDDLMIRDSHHSGTRDETLSERGS
jgi:mRNA interferase MazF